VLDHASERAFPGLIAARSLSLAQACETMRISRRTAYYWIKLGRLRTVRTSGGSLRVLTDSILESTLEHV
jgi:excisionase family DNA binding protein